MQLNPAPPGSRLIAFMISVVAVHGLGANPDYAWTHKGEEDLNNNDNWLGLSWFGSAGPRDTDAGGSRPVNWLRDLLPARIPNSRILCFEYNSRWIGSDLPEPHLYGIAEGLLECLHQMVWIPSPEGHLQSVGSFPGVLEFRETYYFHRP